MEAVKAPEIKTTTKTLEELSAEYSHLCAQAGELQFKAKVIEHNLFELNKKISEVNQSAIALKTAQEAQKETANVGQPH